MARDPSEDRDGVRDEHPTPPDLPTSLVPRWLALVVLLALLGSGVCTTCLVLGSGPVPAPTPVENAP